MENILPVSDLRFYNQTLNDVKDGQHVVLTKNGRAKYVVSDFAEWQKMNATLELFSEVQKGVTSHMTEKSMSLDEFKTNIRNNNDGE
ncbi:prevent-host-death protein [Enterococcus termitis]|uniref:Prevent-host-death protein n=1 Tax=Enterococcus termitis TaxID=332950 RepID=A0A1E5GJ99_9ENTE|nr:prevent-host-death protein [Enterococcus termitis]OEG12757.1 prevent-host-death protein [Enterococcus termitis]